MMYFDTSYLVRLYTRDTGWEKVRCLAANDHIACCLHGKAEVTAAFHRNLREGQISRDELNTLLVEFEKDSVAGGYHWLPLSISVVSRLTKTYASLPSDVALRAADAVHLACAADAGFSKVFSHDSRMLAAAFHFGLKGENIL